MNPIRQWYGRHIPKPGSPRWPYFLAATGALAGVIAGRRVRTITFSASDETASVNLENGVIVLPLAALHPAYYPFAAGDVPAAMVGTIGGLLVHEAMHLVHSVPLGQVLDEVATHIRHAVEQPYARTAFHDVFNVIEDAYVDARARETAEGVFVDVSLDTVLPVQLFEEALDKGRWDQGPHARLAVLSFWLNPSLRKRSFWRRKGVAPFVRLLKQAQGEHSAVKRVEIAWELFKLLLGDQLPYLRDDAQLRTIHTIHKAASESDDTVRVLWGKTPNGSRSGTIYDGDRRSVRHALQSNAADEGLAVPTMHEIEGENERHELRVLGSILDSFMSEAAINAAIKAKGRAKGDALHSVIEVDVTSERMVLDRGNRHYKKMLNDRTDLFSGFAEQLRQLRSKAVSYGAPRESGQVLVNHRLPRIATDGKIFSDPLQRKRYPPEVVILIDLSGSMESSGLIAIAARAAMECFEALITAGFRSVAVYGHTTRSEWPDDGGRSPDEKCLVVHIASWGMNRRRDTDYRARFERVLDTYTSNNVDGYAIAYVGRKFSASRAAEKVLIVMSDGNPCGDNYGDDAGIEHTRREVNKLRARGVTVFGLSLTDWVVNNNNLIYGEAQNLIATDARALALSLRRALSSVTRA